MTAVTRVYTPSEAAAVSEVGIKTVHNAIDRKIVEGKPEGQKHGSSRRALTDGDLLRLKLWHGIGTILSADRRQRLFDAIKAEPSAAMVRADELLIVDVAEAKRQLAARKRSLEEAEAIIHSVKGVMSGEPVFKGTRIPARMIAAMRAQGASVEELVEGYRPLTARMIELAEIWSTAHPARGRPKALAEHGLKVKSVERFPLDGGSSSKPSA